MRGCTRPPRRVLHTVLLVSSREGLLTLAPAQRQGGRRWRQRRHVCTCNPHWRIRVYIYVRVLYTYTMYNVYNMRTAHVLYIVLYLARPRKRSARKKNDERFEVRRTPSARTIVAVAAAYHQSQGRFCKPTERQTPVTDRLGGNPSRVCAAAWRTTVI